MANNYNFRKDVELSQEKRRKPLIDSLALKGESTHPVLKQDHN